MFKSLEIYCYSRIDELMNFFRGGKKIKYQTKMCRSYGNPVTRGISDDIFLVQNVEFIGKTKLVLQRLTCVENVMRLQAPVKGA